MSSKHEIAVCLKIAGLDTIATVEFEITSASHGGALPSLSHPGDPPEGPEFEIGSITLVSDEYEWQDVDGERKRVAVHKPLECPTWLAGALAENAEITDAINEFEANMERPDDYDPRSDV